MAEGEFEFIARHLRPLATARGALASGKLPELRRMTQVLEIHKHDEEPEGLNWARITGITLAVLAVIGAAVAVLFWVL